MIDRHNGGPSLYRGIWSAVRLGPDKRPSNGTVLLKIESDSTEPPPEIKALWVAGEVSICWSSNEELRELSQESLAKLRRTRLHNKLQRTAPLFADELEQREMEERPDFFAGRRP